MSSVRYPKKDTCYLLWEIRDSKIYLLSICTEEWLVKLHRQNTKELYENRGQHERVDFHLHVEKSQLNHLYGAINRGPIKRDM